MLGTMRNRTFLFCALLFQTCLLSMGQRVISFSTNQTTPYRNVAKKGFLSPSAETSVRNGHLIRTYSFRDALVSDVNVNDEAYSYLRVRNFGDEVEIGAPLLPGYTDIVPVDGVPTLSFTTSNCVEYNGYNILPAMRVANEVDSMEMYKNDSIYGRNEFFPKNVVTLQNVQDYQGRRVALVRVNPIQYNPITGIIKCYKNIQYSLSGLSCVQCDTGAVYRSSIKQEKYIVVTNNACIGSVADFVKWKESLGYFVEVLSKDSWLNAKEVRDSIRNAYRRDSTKYDTRFLLIVGGVTVVPAWNMLTTDIYREPSYSTDHYYACMGDEGDELEDVARGRIPGASPEILRKTLNFIVNKEQKGTFVGKGVHAAYFNSKDGKTELLNCVCFSEDVRGFMMSHGFDVKRIYSTGNNTTPLKYNSVYANGDSVPLELRKPNFEWNGSADDIVSSFLDGCDYVLYKGHGTEQGMSQLGFSNSSISSLPDTAFASVVFCMSCLGGQFSRVQKDGVQCEENDCFASKMLRSHRSSALIASSGVCYAPYLEPFGESLFSCMYKDSLLSPQLGAWGYTQLHEYNREPSSKMGEIMNFGFEKMLRNYGMNKFSIKEQTHYHVFGDPGYDFPSCPPVDLKKVKIYKYNDSVYIEPNGISDFSVVFMNSNKKSGEAVYKRFYDIMSNIVFCDTTEYDRVVVRKGNSTPVIYHYPDVYLQNRHWGNGAVESVVGEKVYIGYDVIPDKKHGFVHVESGGTLKIKGTKGVMIKNGFFCDKAAKLQINK